MDKFNLMTLIIQKNINIIDFILNEIEINKTHINKTNIELLIKQIKIELLVKIKELENDTHSN